MCYTLPYTAVHLITSTAQLNPLCYPRLRSEYCRLASKEMRAKVSSQLLPRLRTFSPDLLFISAGFDAHYDDLYHFLDESDFHWLTEQLCGTVDPRIGKVISVSAWQTLLLTKYSPATVTATVTVTATSTST